MAQTYLKTPLGAALIEGDSKGISRISLTSEELPSSEKIPAELQPAVLQLKEYFAGSLNNFDLQLNPEGTPFQKKVWLELQKVPFGRTISYMALSKKLGDPKAIRAVAAANGKNPLWIVVPCHRIIGSDGSLTGYAGGLWRKKWLLEHENPVKQQILFN
ncbi:methylated-DNA--[protein]-cysteine S-methyltransferase [Salinimicrobium sp. GXAS 041]|uniref:methylated-DNA--[protein]-cysteine S-methyltransferase n=1 Tax=Salinimicrobium sp. GXAS 041 TaxID=3400806 RepID=UPI003C785B24